MKASLHRSAIATGILAAVVAGSAVVPEPATAQATRNAEIIVYGTDPCPRSTDDQIVVCRRLPEEQRFRIPPKLRPSGPRQSRNSWVNRSKVFSNQGTTGPLSCSAVGPGGYTGCALQEINQAAREQREATDADTAPPK
ncbi:MAG: hypothetical protein ABR588_02975 [Sphingomicrobium sp.]|nr:hypothetical protein [Sphingomonadales bacterium]